MIDLIRAGVAVTTLRLQLGGGGGCDVRPQVRTLAQRAVT